MFIGNCSKAKLILLVISLLGYDGHTDYIRVRHDDDGGVANTFWLQRSTKLATISPDSLTHQY